MKDAVKNEALGIIKETDGNILFLISKNSYGNYIEAREILKTSIRSSNDKTVLTNSCDTTKSDADLLRDTQNDIDSNNDIFTRKILSIFTKSQSELDRLKLMFDAEKQNIKVYIL